MHYQILGPLEVRREREVVALGGQKPRAVLAVLLLHANEPVSADRLATEVWGDEAPARTTQNVQVTVSRLRKALGDDVVTTTPAGYRLQVRPGELDADRFEELVKLGHEALEAGRAQEAAARLREAERLWHGPPLADVADLPFASDEVRRLEEAQLTALVDRVKAEAAAGDPELVPNLRRLVTQYPAHEWLAGQLMRALYRFGRQAEALAVYQEVRRHLIDEFGIEPGPALRELQKAILQQDPSLKLERLPDELAAAAMSPLVGRAPELRSLLERWERAETGAGTLVAIAGAPGMGKTRLAAELAGEAHRRGAAIAYVSGRGSPGHVLRALGRARDATHPTLLVLDDVEDAGTDVLPAIPEITRALANAPALVLATATAPETLALLRPGTELTLGPLGPDAVRAIAATYVPEREVDEPTTMALLEASGGAPRRVHELAAKWKATRDVEAIAKRAAAGRGELRTMEDELASSVVEFQTTEEPAELHNGDAGPLICPFKGLATFEPADAPYFCGRDRLVAELVAALVGARLLGVVGPSGSGKSSVVRAGLLPALENGVLPGSGQWSRRIMRPGEHPSHELERVTADVAGDGRLVLVVDQFEETFTACRDEDERSRFIAELVQITEDRAGSVVVLALRADFYGRCAAYPKLSRLLAANQVLVGPMRPGELRQAIVLPAERVGLHVETDLVEALVSDVKDEPGALPLLSTALLELWQHRDGRNLRSASYESTGGVLGAVARLAEEAFGRLDERQQRLARRVLLQLAEVEPEGGVERRRLPLEQLERDGGQDVATVIGNLADARLLTISAGAVEFAHEALLREWPRLREWIEDDRENLRVHRNLSSAAQEWVRVGRDEDALYRGARLAEARDWADRGDPGPTEQEREFLDASQQRVAGERAARRRRIRIAFAGLLVALAAITAVAIVALYQGREAERQRDIAASRELAARATSLIDADPRLALALGLRALDRRDTEQAENVVRQATFAARGINVRKAHDGWVYAASLSRDGRDIVTGGEDGAIRVWSVDSGRPSMTIQGRGGPVYGVDLSPDRRHVASAAVNGIVAVYDADGSNRRVVLRTGGGNYANSVQFSPDGSRVVVPLLDGTVRVIPVDGRGSGTVLRGHSDFVYAARFNADGTRVVSAANDGTARIWDIAEGTAITLRQRSAVASAEFSPDGNRVATAGEDGIVRIWPASGHGAPTSFRADEQAVYSVRFDADGGRLATAGEDGVVRLWDASGGPPLGELKGHRGRALHAEFVPGRNTVVSAGEDGTLRLWQPAATSMLRGPVNGDVSFSPDGRSVVSGGADGIVRVWSATSGSLRQLRGASAPSTARFAPDGTHVIGASLDGTVRIWNLEDGRSQVIGAGRFQKNAAAIDRSGVRIAYAGTDPQRRIFVERTDGGDRVVLRGHRGNILDVAFSGDGTQILSASEDGTARIWSTKTGKPERTLRGHAEAVDSAAYSENGSRVVTAGADGTVRVWSLDDGSSVILRGHEGPVYSAEFNRAGDRVVSAGQDGTVRVWDAAGGETLALLYTHGDSATGASWSPDGSEVVSAGADGIVRFTPCEVCGPLSSVLRLAQTRADLELSAVDRERYLPDAG